MDINNNTENNETEQEDKRKIIVTRYYSNYSWRFIYNGKAILDDGTIYGWNYIGDTVDFFDYKVDTEEGLRKYAFEKGKVVDRKVSYDDLEKMKECINNIENILEFGYFDVDKGVCNISVWKDNDEIIIKSMGDCNGENDSEHSQKLLSLINKYI